MYAFFRKRLGNFYQVDIEIKFPCSPFETTFIFVALAYFSNYIFVNLLLSVVISFAVLRRCLHDGTQPGMSFTSVSQSFGFWCLHDPGVKFIHPGTISSRSSAPGRNFIPGSKIHVNT